MMQEVTDTIIQHMVQALVGEASPLGRERRRHKDPVRPRQALRPFRVPVDVLVYSNEPWTITLSMADVGREPHQRGVLSPPLKP